MPEDFRHGADARRDDFSIARRIFGHHDALIDALRVKAEHNVGGISFGAALATASHDVEDFRHFAFRIRRLVKGGTRSGLHHYRQMLNTKSFLHGGIKSARNFHPLFGQAIGIERTLSTIRAFRQRQLLEEFLGVF